MFGMDVVWQITTTNDHLVLMDDAGNINNYFILVLKIETLTISAH